LRGLDCALAGFCVDPDTGEIDGISMLRASSIRLGCPHR
jgi:hypothetical protein